MANVKVQVGEYVRTNNGDIFKVANFYQKGNIYTMVDERGVLFGNPKKVVKKHDFDIIKLIEIGDYVNGILVFNITIATTEKGDEWVYIGRDEQNILPAVALRKETIKTIVTKEQFKSIEYVVGEEDD